MQEVRKVGKAGSREIQGMNEFMVVKEGKGRRKEERQEGRKEEGRGEMKEEEGKGD